MSIGEKNSLTCETVHIWRLRLRMTAKDADPVVEIVNGDEEYVGLLGGEAQSRGDAQQEGSSKH